MWISARTLVLHRVVLLWTVAYFLFQNPILLYANFFVVAVGSKLPQIYDADPGFAGLVATLLLISALQDMVILFQEQWLTNFRVIVPVRLCVLFASGLASYMELSPALAKGPIFALLFFDSILNFFIYTAVREEMNEELKKEILADRGNAGDEQ